MPLQHGSCKDVLTVSFNSTRLQFGEKRFVEREMDKAVANPQRIQAAKKSRRNVVGPVSPIMTTKTFIIAPESLSSLLQKNRLSVRTRHTVVVLYGTIATLSPPQTTS